VAGEIVATAMQNMNEDKIRDFERSRSMAATTLLVLHLFDDEDCNGKPRIWIDACEIGDSRWAVLRWNAQDSRYECKYLADE